ncbi:MAG: rRNA maturation RNase YbeY [Phycisphaerales bacterium]|jgi:probable rRNA maturation factor|nr:rRNA maturation RNase YbeY [Phycisphaerales bacterium]
MEEQTDQSNEPPPEPRVTIVGTCDFDVTWIEERVNLALLFLGNDCAEVCVRIVDDSEMSHLHNQHSGVDGTTDVLTFDRSTNSNLELDIAVCVDVARRAIETNQHTLEAELLLYVVHGILHCIGFDDHTKENHERMHQEEDRVLEAIGVGAIWSQGL